MRTEAETISSYEFRAVEMQVAVEALVQIQNDNIRIREYDLDAHRKLNEGFRYRNVNYLINSVTKWRLLLDWYLDKVISKRTLSSLSQKELNTLRTILLFFVFSRENFPDRVALFNFATANNIGKHFIDLTMGALDHISIDDFETRMNLSEFYSIKYSHPLWMVRRWMALYEKLTVKNMLIANNTSDPLVIRSNGVSLSLIEESLRSEHIEYTSSNYHKQCLIIKNIHRKLSDISAYKEMLFQVQAEMPAFVGNLLQPRNGDLILDMCSAPGGKLSHIATLIQFGEIDSVDIDSRRINDVNSTIERMKNIRPNIKMNAICADGKSYNGHGKLYDRILIDAPCSGLGVLSRHADARWHRNERSIEEYATTQENILDNCSKLLKPGGLMAYSTCTIEPEENENQIYTFLMKHKEFSLVSVQSLVPRDLVSESGVFYYPKKFAPASFCKIQSGFAALMTRK